LNTLKKILYCSADTGIAGAEVLVRVSLLAFYSKVVGLSSDVVGLAIAVAVFWDAVSDPLMGFISDRYTILGQHRRPYFVIGGAVLSVSLYYLFNPPALESINSKVLFLSVWYILMNTGMTILAVPHTALVEKLGQSSHERTILFGWKLFFANIGLMLGSGLPGVFDSIYGE
jgi:GPH family glycoside/pentoside/hexuronide:cation symporter